MVFRGIAARQLPSLATFALTAVVVAGTVVAVAYSRLTSVPEGSAGALLLLGLVALVAQTSESVRRRRHDLALARLRGRRGLRLLSFAIAEPAVVVLAGAVVGVLCGWVVAKAATAAWLPGGTSLRLTEDEWLAAGSVTAGCLLIVTASAWRLLRMPLLQQLAPDSRPTSGGVWAIFLRLVLVLGAVVAIYQAHQDAKSRVDWVSLVSPAVVGLAAAQILVWLLRAFFALVVPRDRGARFGWFLTARRLVRRSDSLALIRIIVAAGVVFGVAASASAAAEGGREEQAKLRVGGPVSYPISGGALRAYAIAHHADPKGEWLLAAAAYTTDPSQGARRVYVDSPRWQRVVGDFYADTATSGLTRALKDFPVTPSTVERVGDAASLTIPTASVPGIHHFRVVFQYVNDTGDLTEVNVEVGGGLGKVTGPGLTTFAHPLRDCHLACDLIEIDISGHASTGRLHFVDARFAGADAVSAASGFQPTNLETQFLRVRRAPGGGIVLGSGGIHNYLGSIVGTYRTEAPVPAVSTPRASFVLSTGPPAIPSIDGSDRPIHVVARVPVLPFVGTSGSVLDLRSTLLGARSSVPTTDALVVARADTPAAVLRALSSYHGVGHPTTFSAALERLARTPRAQGTRLYLLVAAFAALIAVLGLAAGVAQQRTERRLEAASLRSAGVRTGQINDAYRTEVLVLGSATLVGTAIACWASCRALLGSLPLVSGWAFAPPLDASPRTLWVLVCSVGAAVLVAGIGYLAFRRIGKASAPRLLREEAT